MSEAWYAICLVKYEIFFKSGQKIKLENLWEFRENKVCLFKLKI